MDTLDLLRALFRSTPSIRGKYRMMHALARGLGPSSPERCTKTVRMWDGTRMRLDYRSLTERVPFWTGEYERRSIERLASCLDDDSVVIDVGANIGFYAIALGRRLMGGGKLYAFEPVPTNHARLIENVALNGLQGTVVPFRVALGDEEGEVQLGLAEPDGAGTGNAVIMKGTVEKRATCFAAPLSTLDKFAEEHGIGTCRLLKADVEGAEVMLLRGATRFIGKCRPIIYAEFNNLFIRQMGASFLDAAQIMAPLRYRMFVEKPAAHSFDANSRSGAFVPLDVVREGIEHVLLVPQETPRDLLAKLGLAAT